MKFYIYIDEKVVGPYLPEEITGQFGGVSSDTLVWPEAGHESGLAQWRAIHLVPELGGCVKREISGPLEKYSPASAMKSPLKILSTDDDANIRALLWHMLTDAGHAVEFAKDGEEVFTRLAAKKYDLVVLDVNMPKMNGYRVAEILHTKLPDPPKVLIFTGRDLEKERLQFECSGADAILSKGTGNDKLIQTIENLFSGKSEKAVKEARVFVPEPAPQGIGGFSFPDESVKLRKEEFYGGTDYEKAGPPAEAAPRHMAEIEAAEPPAAACKTDEKAPPAVQSPAAGHETGGKPDAAVDQLMLESKALKSELADIRKLLARIESEYAHLEEQLEKQTLKILDKNREAAQKLETDWQNLRNCVMLAILLLLVAILAAVLPG